MIATYDPCAGCGAPLDEHQRYCVRCGENRRHPDDPVARYLRQTRQPVTVATAPAGPAPRSRTDVWLVALALAMLPAAAAAGVAVGGGKDSGPSDQALIAALKASGTGAGAAAPAAAATVAATTVADAAPTGPIVSDFTADRGFVVRLKVLPAGTDAGGAQAAKDAADGAPKLGVLVTKDFKLRPAVKGPYLLYSGPYPSKAAAEKALAKLRKDFPGAEVVAVKKPSLAEAVASGSKADQIAAADEASLKQKHPTEEQKQQGAEVVQQIQSKQGQSYVDQQQQLPDTIVVP